MGAFVAILHHRGEPVAEGELRRLAAALPGPGDALTVRRRGAVGIAIRHRRDEKPLVEMEGEGGGWRAWAGHGRPGSAPSASPSAAGVPVGPLPEADRDAVLGPYAQVTVDPSTRSLRITSDPLGAQAVHHVSHPRFLVASSDAAPLLRHPDVSADPDEGAVARFLGFRFGDDGRSFFRQVRQLPAGHRLVADAEGTAEEQWWRFGWRDGGSRAPTRRGPGNRVGHDRDGGRGDGARGDGSRGDEAWADEVRDDDVWGTDVWSDEARDEASWDEAGGAGQGGDRHPGDPARRFRRRLRRAVLASLAGVEPPQVALSLSGGLDSTALAALAPAGVRAFSWTFRATPEADEGRRIEAVAEHLGLPVRWIAAEGAEPLAGDFAERFVDPETPFVNPFAALKQRLFEAARAEGCRRVMVGDGGDALYGVWEHWLRDLLTDHPAAGLGSLAGTLARAVGGDRAARRALHHVPPFTVLHRHRRRTPPPWLTSEGRSLLPPDAPPAILPPGPAGRRFEASVGARDLTLEREEQRLFRRGGVERADPFWSPALLGWAVGLPAWRLHRDGRHKLLTRRALAGRLPAAVLEGPGGGSLGPFFLGGLEARRDDLRHRVFRRPRSDWKRYVRPDRVEPYLDATGAITFGHTLLWRVICYELWCRRRIEGTAAGWTPEGP